MVGTHGESYTDVDCTGHLKQTLPDPYLHSRDLKSYLETLRDVVAGRTTVDQAIKKMPKLKRVGGMSSLALRRWVVEESVLAGRVHAHDRLSPLFHRCLGAPLRRPRRVVPAIADADAASHIVGGGDWRSNIDEAGTNRVDAARGCALGSTGSVCGE
jgi:hypothetical protein